MGRLQANIFQLGPKESGKKKKKSDYFIEWQSIVIGWLLVGQKKELWALFREDIISLLRIRSWGSAELPKALAPMLLHWGHILYTHKHPGSLEDKPCPLWLFIQTPNTDSCSAASQYIESTAYPESPLLWLSNFSICKFIPKLRKLCSLLNNVGQGLLFLKNSNITLARWKK